MRLLLASLLFIAFFGCDLFTGECETSGKAWCEGNVIKECEAKDHSFLANDNTVVTSTTCADSQYCVDWTVHPDNGSATCVSKVACVNDTTFCINDSAIATCPEGAKKPKVDACGDDNFEGYTCQETSNGPACVFRPQECAPEGASLCNNGSRYYTTCAGGYWSELNSCLLGESCVQTDGGVECELQVKE